MKKLWRSALIFFTVLALIVQGCGDDDDYLPCDDKDRAIENKVYIIKEMPVFVARTIGPDVTSDPITYGKWQKVIEKDGPGSFISAIISKKGGDTGDLSKKTTVRLKLDNKKVLIKSFEIAYLSGLTQQNYSGIVYLEGKNNIETLVLGFQEPLFFKRVMELWINVEDTKVEKVLLTATLTKEDTGEDEGGSGDNSETRFP